jgi:hypothetical protein
MERTPVSLLEGLRQPEGQQAWARSVHLYTPLFFYQTLTSASVPYDAAAAGPIGPGQSAHRQYPFTLPVGPAGAGQIQVTVTTNVNHDISERNNDGTADTNNTATLTVQSTVAAPDLQVGSLSIEPASGLRSGSNLVVHWAEVNAGNAAAAVPFSDSVTIRHTTTGETLAAASVGYDPGAAGNGTIAAGRSRAERKCSQKVSG